MSFGRRDVIRDGAAPASSALVLIPQRVEAAAAEPVAPHTSLTSLREQVLKEIDPSVAGVLPSEVLARQIEEIVHSIANRDRLGLSGQEQARFARDLADDVTGYGPLQGLLLDETVNDIMVNGPHNVYVERSGVLERTIVRFRDAEHVIAIAQKIVNQIGRRVDESSPMVDARLPDGSRVNIVLPPASIDGPCISIRKFPKRRYDLPAMVKNGTMNSSVSTILEVAARCRLNILISGGTGSGKTTLLNAISRYIDHSERVVTIEDAAELQLQQPHVIRLETRPPNLEGSGQITQRNLVWNALRMRPDRIIVGEVRSDEAFDMLQAMNTGHDGSVSTVHANSTRDALTRVENMVQMGAVNLPVQAIRQQIVGALDLIIQVERMRDGQRRITEVTEIVGMEGDIITTNNVASFVFHQEDAQGKIKGNYKSTQAQPKFLDRLAYFGLDRLWLETIRQI